jgi:hypothetical protein
MENNNYPRAVPPRVMLDNDNFFNDFTTNYDLDAIEAIGPPEPILNEFGFHWDIGGPPSRGKVLSPHNCLIAYSPFNLEIPQKFKEPLALKIQKHFGTSLKLHADPKFLFDSPPRRLVTQDLINYLDEIGCKSCIANSYAWKAKLTSQLTNRLYRLSRVEGVTLYVDIGVEEIPSYEEENFIPIVGLNIKGMTSNFPAFKKCVLPSFVPFQCDIKKRSKMFGGVQIERFVSNRQSNTKKIKVYAKMAHYWKAITKTESVYVPQFQGAYRRSEVIMGRIQNEIRNKAEQNKILRYEVTTKWSGNIRDMVQHVSGEINKIRKCIVIYECPLDTLLLLMNNVLDQNRGSFRTNHDARLWEERKTLYCVMMSLSGVSNEYYNKYLFNNYAKHFIPEEMELLLRRVRSPKHEWREALETVMGDNSNVNFHFVNKNLEYRISPFPDNVFLPAQAINNDIIDLNIDHNVARMPIDNVARMPTENTNNAEDDVIDNDSFMGDIIGLGGSIDVTYDNYHYDASADENERILRYCKFGPWRGGLRSFNARGHTTAKGATVEVVAARVFFLYGYQWQQYCEYYTEDEVIARDVIIREEEEQRQRERERIAEYRHIRRQRLQEEQSRQEELLGSEIAVSATREFNFDNEYDAFTEFWRDEQHNNY